MKRKKDTLQLEFSFTYGDEDNIELLKRADDIIQKYLIMYDRAFRKAYIDNDRNSRNGKFIEKVCRKALDKLIASANKMLVRLNLPLCNFAELERMYQVYPIEYPEWKDTKRKLDAFGYIQEEFDEKQSGEHIGIIGYHYWLFEDAIARIYIPDVILEKYASKYANDN